MEIKRAQVDLVGSEHVVPLSAFTKKIGATRVFLHSGVHFVLGSGHHDSANFRETKDVMVLNFK